MAPLIGVRVAGAPVEDLQRLRFSETWVVIKEHVALSGWLQAEGQVLSDLLFPVIGGCADGGLKPLLVALRRAVFQGSAPGDRAWSERVRVALPADLCTRITAWVSGWERAKSWEARVAEVLEAEKVVRTSALRVAVGDDAFRFGLLLGSPTLAEALGQWTGQPSAGPAPRGQVLLRAAKYLARAVAKTSPYASFTLSGLGGWAPSGPASSPTGELSWHGVAELERRVVVGIWSALADHPQLREHIQVRVNPSTAEAGGQLRFLGAASGEPVVGVALTETLRSVLEFLRTTPRPTLGSLRRHLAATSTVAQPGRVVDELAGLGLLELCRPFADQDPDPLGAVARWVAAITDVPAAGASGWHQTLRELRAAVRGYPELADAPARARRLRHIHRTLAELLTELTPPGAAALHVRDLVRENAVITHPVVSCGWEQWRPVLDDLEALRGFLGILNPHLTAQASAAAFFRDRFSPGALVGFLDFYRELHAAHPPADGRDALDHLVGEPPAQDLVTLRQTAVAELYRGSEDASGIVRVDPRALGTIAVSWPPGIRAPGSICCYAQPLPGPGGPRLVLNTVRTGYGWGTSRIHHLLTQQSRLQAGQGAPPPWPARPGTGEPGVLLVECRGAFATNLSLRPAAVPHALDYPGAGHDTGGAAQVSIAELTVSYDPVRERLVLRERHGAEVRPLALGMLVEHSLPPALYFLIRVFGEPQTALSPAWQLGEPGWCGTAGGPRRRPRLELGHLVLVRAAWSLPAGQLPRRAKGESDAAYLLRVARWRDQHGIPAQCFVHLRTRPGSSSRNRSKARKPLYLEFTNWFLLTAFERSLAQLEDPAAVVVFEEALPGLADAPRYGEHGQRVTEYIVELSAATADG